VQVFVLTKVLIYHNARNEWSSQIRKRRVIHTNSARHGLLFCETWRSNTSNDEDCVLSTGEGLRKFRWKVVPSSWTVGPEDEDKLTSRQGATSQMTWIFKTVRISQPTTVVPKRRQETINRRCVKSQKQRNKYLWTHLPFNVRDKFSYEHACATVLQPKAGVFNLLLCHGNLWESSHKNIFK
jgi:hypothetical protein